jgi:hypothetical protein
MRASSTVAAGPSASACVTRVSIAACASVRAAGGVQDGKRRGAVAVVLGEAAGDHAAEGEADERGFVDAEVVEEEGKLVGEVLEARVALRRGSFAVADQVVGQGAEAVQVGKQPLPDGAGQAEAVDQDDDGGVFGAGQVIGGAVRGSLRGFQAMTSTSTRMSTRKSETRADRAGGLVGK